MNEKWEKVNQIIAEISDNPSGDNVKKHLTTIFEQAEKWDIDPDLILKANKSNLSTIIKEARIAIQNDDKDALVDLFWKAATLTNKLLRLEVVKPKRDIIFYEEVKVGNKTIYRLEVQAHQLDLIEKGTILQLDFQKHTQED